MSTIRFIERYKPFFPLIGTQVNECLDLLEAAFKEPSKHRGLVVYIEGEGGTGKSEIFEQIKLMLAGRKSNSILELEAQTPTIPIEDKDAPLFGGIIDLYNYSSYFGRNVEEILIKYWAENYHTRIKEFNRHSNYRKNIVDYFNSYNANLAEFNEFRFALPIVENVEKLVAERRLNLDNEFLDGLAGLTNNYTPIICFDTAELLEQEDEEEEPSTLATDTLDWLNKFLDTQVSKNCIVIIAGRPKNENKKTVMVKIKENDQTKTVSLREFLAGKREEAKFKAYKTGNLEAGGIKAYIYWYHLYSPNRILLDNPPPESIVDLDEFTRKAETNWDDLVNTLKDEGVFPSELKVEQIYQHIVDLTKGKPLFLDWLCQLAFEQNNVQTVPGLRQGGETGENEFKDRLGRIIGLGEFAFNSKLDPHVLQQILRYTFVARKGLDMETALLLSKAENKPLTPEDAKTALADLLKSRFIKIRSIENERTENLVIYFHDEIYNSLSDQIENYLQNSILDLYDELARTYVSDKNYKRSIRYIERQHDELRKPTLELNSETKKLEQVWWWDGAQGSNNIRKFLNLEIELQNRLVERLYYRLRKDFKQGYDEFCLVDMMAIVEQEVSLDVRLKKEYLRNEWVLTKEQRQALGSDFWEYRNLECKVRSAKRYYRDNPGNPNKAIEQLKAIAATNIDDNTSNRIKLCKFDAFITLYEYDQIPEIEIVSGLEDVIKQLNEIKLDIPIYQKGDVRDYVFWYKYILLGRAYYSLGKIFTYKDWDLDTAIAYHRKAIEAYKQARNRNEIYLNDVRNVLAYVYNLRGYQNMALETIRVSLTNHQNLGHKVYIALAQNILAQILLSSSGSIYGAYEFSQNALDLLESVFTTEERKEFAPYNLVARYNGEISHRLGRYYAINYKAAQDLHEYAIKNLKSALDFYNREGSKANQFDALNELGCVYRSYGRTLQIYLSSLGHENEKKAVAEQRDAAFKKAQKYLVEANEICKDNPSLWYQNLDNLLDQAQLAGYRHCYELFGEIQENAVVAAFQQVTDEIEKLKTTDEATGKQLYFKLIQNKTCFRYADWNWKCYEDVNLNENSDLEQKARLRPDKTLKELLKLYISKQIEALNWYTEFQPNLLVDKGLDPKDHPFNYSRDSLYINQLDASISDHLRGIRERKIAIEEVQHLLGNLSEPKPGTIIFCYIIDIANIVNLPEKIAAKRKRDQDQNNQNSN